MRLADALDYEHGGRRLIELAARLGRTATSQPCASQEVGDSIETSYAGACRPSAA